MQPVVFHDPARPEDRSPIGPVPAGSPVTLTLRCPGGEPEPPLSVSLQMLGPTEAGYEMTWQDKAWQVSFVAPETVGSYSYRFYLNGPDESWVYGPDGDGRGSVGTLYPAGTEAPCFRLTVYDPAFTAPEWLRQGIMYQIFPDRFAKGDEQAVAAGLEYHRALGRKLYLHENWLDQADWKGRGDKPQDYQPLDLFGGTLDAIGEKAGYLASLGVSVLYLNPIFEAASNHRYNTADYCRVDPVLGDEAAFTRLCRTCREHGIRVILDGVFSHTGADSRYFDINDRYGGGGYRHPDSPYRSWYDFDPCYTHGYRCWWDFPTLPEVNEEDPAWQDFMLKSDNAVVKRWLRAGASGWRLDVADELPDPILEEIRRQVKAEDPEAAIIGEVWEDAVSKVSYDQHRTYALGRALDSVMNYPLGKALLDFALGKLDGWQLAQFLLGQRLNYPPPLYYSLMNLLSSHDVARVRTVLALGGDGQGLSREEQAAIEYDDVSDRRAARLQLLLAALIWSLPGMPTIYYGDEEGMTGLRDPFDRQTFRKGPHPLVKEYAALSRLRKEHAVLTEGAAAFPAAGAEIGAVLRWDGRSCLLTLVNRSAEAVRPMVDILRDNAGLTGAELASLKAAGFRRARDLWGESAFPVERGLLRPEIPPEGFLILELS